MLAFTDYIIGKKPVTSFETVHLLFGVFSSGVVQIYLASLRFLLWLLFIPFDLLM